MDDGSLPSALSAAECGPSGSASTSAATLESVEGQQTETDSSTTAVSVCVCGCVCASIAFVLSTLDRLHFARRSLSKPISSRTHNTNDSQIETKKVNTEQRVRERSTINFSISFFRVNFGLRRANIADRIEL